VVLEDDAVVDAVLFRPAVRAIVAELDALDAAAAAAAAADAAAAARGAGEGAGEGQQGGGAGGGGGGGGGGAGGGWDLCYLYVYPDHWPAPPRRVVAFPGLRPLRGDGGGDGSGGSSLGEGAVTQAGFHTWCLVAYVVSQKGAARLAALVEAEDMYAPVDNMVSDWRARGLLDVRCPAIEGFVENGGQLDLRGVGGEGGSGEGDKGKGDITQAVPATASGGSGGRRRMPSNIWGSPSWKDVNLESLGS